MLLLTLLCLFFASDSISASTVAASPGPELLRERVVYRLQNIVNEFELLIKNRAANEADLRKAERDFQLLRGFERIPREPDLEGLLRQLRESAKTHHLEVSDLQVTGRSEGGSPVPRFIASDGPRFRLTEEQLTEILLFSLVIKGADQDVRKWIQSFPDGQVRLVRMDQAKLAPHKKGLLLTGARAFRFRDVRFPEIQPVDPRKVVPAQLASVLSEDAEVESLTRRALALRERAAPFYAIRGELLLAAARSRVLHRYSEKSEN